MQIFSPAGFTAATPWASVAQAASSVPLRQWAESGGGTALAMAVQQHLLLASTAKAGGDPGAAAGAAAWDKENGEKAARQLTLTASKASGPSAAAASAGPQLTSSNVRMRLHALLDGA